MSNTRLQMNFDSLDYSALENITLPSLDLNSNNFVLNIDDTEINFAELLVLANESFSIINEINFLELSDDERVAQFDKVYHMLLDIIGKELLDQKNKLINIGKVENKTESEDEIIDGVPLYDDQIARLLFQTGYTLAMKAAVSAANETDELKKQEGLKQAYAKLAFSCHFMVNILDQRRSRTPRSELMYLFGQEIGSTLALFQHNEDNDFSLDVEIKNMDKYDYLRQSTYKTCNAVKLMIDEIFQAFQCKEEKPYNQSGVVKLLPNPDRIKHPPMFKIENDILYNRIVKDESIDKYEELTHAKANEILIFHYHKTADQLLRMRIDDCKKKLYEIIAILNEEVELNVSSSSEENIEPQENSADEYVSHLVTHSFFRHRYPSNIEFELNIEDEDKYKARCPSSCNIL